MARKKAKKARPAPRPRRAKRPAARKASSRAARKTASKGVRDRTRPPTPGVPSSLTVERRSSAARSGRAALQGRLRSHPETDPAITAGDVDADWEQAYRSGEEAPGGDNPTPDQEVVEEIGRALGVEYQDNEELKGADKIAGRDRHRWELNPASSEDYKERLPAPKKKRL